ncbi:iron ABC transporter ATP-binding protein [Salipiger thiooxidans]|uniref:iron ABC transporter ATP-binding protein n=1 Tax=Salipiger thiooxidans TaxID=282683 RepID=UPI001CD67718|nr:ATP-binding cassette domain-containing protein [Salipiger thiooxidans]MCA0851309.1 ATP-binding cassette domain-containing protein [Salipiger thiooxidans]
MITVTDLSMTYGGKTVLHGITAGIPRGKLISLIGPNAAGKSTLLMLMARLLQPTGGQVTLDDTPVAEIPGSAFARRVATLRQAPGLDLRLSVEDLVAFGRFPYSRGRLTDQDHAAIDRALTFLSLNDLRHRNIDELSGGQRQLAYLAMTIAQDTDCLLLDEPLNNLDMHHAVQIMRALRQLCDAQGRTIVLVIHDINFAANYSDHILALKDGRLVGSGPVAEMVTEERLGALYALDFQVLRNGDSLLCNYFTQTDRI